MRAARRGRNRNLVRYPFGVAVSLQHLHDKLGGGLEYGKLSVERGLGGVHVKIDFDADLATYLGACEVIDFRAPNVTEMAQQLSMREAMQTAERCFHFVRDEIKHTADFKLAPITCRASDVLEHGTGYCYAKSHLLCALLRANQIPAGLAYQRLSLDGAGPPFCLHGLNAVYLPDFGWYRLDPRGNREGIDSRFAPPREYLAFATQFEGECDLPRIYAAPRAEVVAALTQYDTWQALDDHLPDARI